MLADADQDVAIRGQGRLHDAGSRRPRVLPKHLAVGGRDAGRAGVAQQQDLRDSVDGQQLRRAVAHAAGRAEPARIAGGEVVGDEFAGGGDDDDVVDHQRRAREAPLRSLHAGVGRGVARPYDGAVARRRARSGFRWRRMCTRGRC